MPDTRSNAAPSATAGRFRYQRRDTLKLPSPPPYNQRFTYPEMRAVTGPTGRTYTTPKGKFASITTMLSATQSEEKREGLAQWREAVGDEVADATTLESSEFGTLIHDTMEAYLKGEVLDAKKLHPLARRAISDLTAQLDGNFTETWALEVPLYSPSLCIAGRTDVVGIWKGEPVILDYKTSRSPKTAERIEDYFLQLLFYALAHNELYGTKIRRGVIAMAVMSGKSQLFEVDLWDEALWLRFEDRLVQFHGEELPC